MSTSPKRKRAEPAPPLNYTCRECGARAVATPEAPHVARVTVPHRAGCPIAARLGTLRSQLLRTEARPA